MADRSRTWDGGYVRTDARGRDVYVIRQRVNGTRYEISTRAFTERAAQEHWKRFQADPEGYDPRGEVRPEAIHLDVELAQQFLTYSRAEKQNTKEWVTKQRKMLAWWAEKLKRTDLRGASVRDAFLPPLEGVSGKLQKVAVLKALYTYLRKVRREITLAEDPTAAGGFVMPPEPRRKRRSKAVRREHVELAREHLIGSWRDALDLQAATGWHVSEVQRFTTAGEIDPAAPAQRQQGIAGVLVVEHKSGEQHRTAASADTVAAARRLRERAGFSIAWYHRAVLAACKAAGIPQFGPGRMRHSVATWAVNAGADLATVSTFLGHRSARTTKKFYATHATPRNPLIVVPSSAPRTKAKRARGNAGGAR